jgi:hypothetical protein
MVLFTKGNDCRGFLGDPTGTGLDMPSQTHREWRIDGRSCVPFSLAALALTEPVASTARS